MRCALNQWRLSRAADQHQGTLSARVATHTQDCATCARFQASLERLGSSLRSARHAAPAAELAPPRPWTLPALAMVSVAAVAIGLFFAFGRDADRNTQADKNTHGDKTNETDQQRIAPAPNARDQEAPPEQRDQRVAVRDAPVDVKALAGDASGGLKYVLRVSGLQ